MFNNEIRSGREVELFRNVLADADPFVTVGTGFFFLRDVVFDARARQIFRQALAPVAFASCAGPRFGFFFDSGGRFLRLFQGLFEQVQLVRINPLGSRTEQAAQQIIDAVFVLFEVRGKQFDKGAGILNDSMARLDVVGKRVWNRCAGGDRRHA